MREFPQDSLIGSSPAFQAATAAVSQLAPLDRPVLVIGERGTGKELIAQRLHYLSDRWDGPLVTVNCAALSDSLLESELFGHEAGAFTGAARRRIGRLEAADGGTLFLDEIADAAPAVQERLLRAIEYGVIERLGSERPTAIDVRIVAATNRDLPALAAAGEFRADLLDRLAFAVITLPPLRARAEDIPALAEHFAVRMTRALSRPLFPGFSPAALDMLAAHDWPGNVRELKNTVERAVALTPAGEMIDTILLDPFASPWRPAHPVAPAAPAAAESDNRPPPVPYDFQDRLLSLERDWLIAALAANRHHQKRTAEFLRLHYHQLRHLMKKHGLHQQTEA